MMDYDMLYATMIIYWSVTWATGHTTTYGKMSSNSSSPHCWKKKKYIYHTTVLKDNLRAYNFDVIHIGKKCVW